MKIQYNLNLDLQKEAINAVVDLFDGQEVYQSKFTVAPFKGDLQTVFRQRGQDQRRPDFATGRH